MRVFCYGTLKRNGGAHHLMQNARFIDEARTSSNYQLFKIGHFPGMRFVDEADGDGVVGEIYECDAATMKKLDLYEGVEDGLFERTEIEINDGSKAQAYLFADWEHFGVAARIISGEWANTL